MAALSGNLRGIVWMCVAAVFFAAMLATVRGLSEHLALMQIVFLRAFGSFVVMVPWALAVPRRALVPTQPKMLLFRTVILFAGVCTYYYSVYHIPIAEAVAIQFTVPLFTSLLAIAFLGERPGIHRWAATAVAIVGALVIVRPGFQEIHPAVISVILSAMFYGGDNVSLRILGRSESAAKVVFYMSLMMSPMALAPALFDWRPITWAMAPQIAMLAVFTVGAHFTLARAFAEGEASVVSPFSFLRMPVAAVLGYLVFGQTSDVWVWIGAVIIFAATSYMAQREHRAGRAARH